MRTLTATCVLLLCAAVAAQCNMYGDASSCACKGGQSAEDADMTVDVAIIGAGISGTYTGWRLATATKKKVVIFERHNYTGGRFVSEQIDPAACGEARCELGGMRVRVAADPAREIDILMLKVLQELNIPHGTFWMNDHANDPRHPGDGALDDEDSIVWLRGFSYTQKELRVLMENITEYFCYLPYFIYETTDPASFPRMDVYQRLSPEQRLHPPPCDIVARDEGARGLLLMAHRAMNSSRFGGLGRNLMAGPLFVSETEAVQAKMKTETESPWGIRNLSSFYPGFKTYCDQDNSVVLTQFASGCTDCKEIYKYSTSEAQMDIQRFTLEKLYLLQDIGGYHINEPPGVAINEDAMIGLLDRTLNRYIRPLAGMQDFPLTLEKAFVGNPGNPGQVVHNRRLVHLERLAEPHLGAYHFRLKFELTETNVCNNRPLNTGVFQTVYAREVVSAMGTSGALSHLHIDGFTTGELHKLQQMTQQVTEFAAMKLFIAWKEPWWTSYTNASFGRQVTSDPANQAFLWYPGTQVKNGEEQCPDFHAIHVYTANVNLYWQQLIDGDNVGPCNRQFKEAPNCSICYPEDEFFSGRYNQYANQTVPNSLFRGIRNQLSRLFGVPEHVIPTPLVIKYRMWQKDDRVTQSASWHFWKPGVQFWKTFHEMLKPFDSANFYVVGEAFSYNQGWGQGALETAEVMLQKHMNVPAPYWLSPAEFCGVDPYFHSDRYQM